MVVYCCVHECISSAYKRNKKENEDLIQFFGFPSNPVIKKRWIEAFLAAGHNEEHMAKIKKYSRVCSLHFATNCIEKIGFSRGRLKENSVPTIFPNALLVSIDKNTPQTDIRQCEETNDETVSTKRMCYVGDINIKKVRSMSPKTIAKSMDILKRTHEKKKALIKRLRVQLFRQKRKIERLEASFSEFQTKGLFSPISSDTVQV